MAKVTYGGSHDRHQTKDYSLHLQGNKRNISRQVENSTGELLNYNNEQTMEVAHSTLMEDNSIDKRRYNEEI